MWKEQSREENIPTLTRVYASHNLEEENNIRQLNYYQTTREENQGV